MTQASGAPKIVNLSGGLFRSATPTQIPEISLSDMKNFDIQDNALVTRSGMKFSNSAPFYPGCMQFGFSDTQRVHYLETGGGDYGPQTTSPTQQTTWGLWFYAKELTSTTARRDLFNFQDASGNVLISVYFGTDSRLHLGFRPNSTESLYDMAEGAGGEQVLRTSTTHLYGVTIKSNNGGTIVGEIYNSFGSTVQDQDVFSTTTWSTAETLIIGCDENTTYPDEDWTNGSNNAFYGYIGEVVIVRDKPYETTNTFNEMARSPGETVSLRQRVAHYPLQKNTDDVWGNNPSFPLNIYRTGGGNSNYSVSDSIITGARDILFNTKSWEIDTFGINTHVFGRTNSLSSRYRSYLNGVSTTYTITLDILPAKVRTGTYTLLEATTAGPYIKISKKDNGRSQIEYGHVFNASNTTAITHNISNSYVSKISCQYGRSSRTATTIGMKIFQDTMQVASTTDSLTSSTVPATVGNLQLGTGDTTSISSNLFVSGIILHNVKAGDTWGDRPQETFENVTTYTTVVRRRRRRHSRSGFFGSLGIVGEVLGITGGSGVRTTEVQVPSGTKAERQGDGDMSYSIVDLPLRDSVVGGWLFTEVTGYDTATDSTPHGVITNIFSSSTTDNTDFILRNNSQPIWIADRYSDAGLATTDFLDGVFEDEADNVINYTPVNSNLGSRIFVTRNARLIDTNGNNFDLGDTYRYNNRLSGKVRGFTYGNSLYVHNEESYLRFNGNVMRPVEVITPSIPLSLSKDSTPSTGLNGAYKYTYSLVDKSGVESYPALPTSITVSTGLINISLNPKISNSSFLNEQIQEINIYRNKGGTTATTNLTRDADKSLYLLKTVPLSAVKDAVGSTLFSDTTADAALGGNPPEPDTADPMPTCRYSAVYSDTIIMTGDPLAPNAYYQSQGQTPELLGIPGTGEFLTEDGEHNTGVASIGGGFIVFKENSRKFIRGGVGGESYEYDNGGCMAHDSLVSMGNRAVGLGPNGFFVSDGHNYDDITSVAKGGRVVSSIHYDVDQWSSATKRAAVARYHAPTERYICYVDGKYYIFDFRYRVWTKYEDVVGFPFDYDNEFYTYARGWLYKEADQAYVGTTVNRHSITSGTVGKVQIVTTTSLPATSTYGLPAYVGTSFYWTTAISKTGTTHDVYLSTTKNLSNATDFSLGALRAYADTKFFQMRTPLRNKIFRRFLLEHGNTADGEMKIRIARNQGNFDRGYAHYTADTDIEKINTVLRVRSENMSVEMAVEDGKEHTIRNYSIVYDQESVK